MGQRRFTRIVFLTEPHHKKIPPIEEFKDLYDHYNNYRSEIIDGATFVENSLDVVLCDALAGQDQVRRDRLRANVLNSESFSFFQKWRTLRSLLKEQPNWLQGSVDSVSEHLRDLHTLINDRNRFAHGRVAIDPWERKAVLIYFEAGGERPGEKRFALDEAAMQDIIGRLEGCHQWLGELNERFRYLCHDSSRRERPSR